MNRHVAGGDAASDFCEVFRSEFNRRQQVSCNYETNNHDLGLNTSRNFIYMLTQSRRNCWIPAGCESS